MVTGPGVTLKPTLLSCLVPELGVSHSWGSSFISLSLLLSLSLVPPGIPPAQQLLGSQTCHARPQSKYSNTQRSCTAFSNLNT
jgi:hypothetical protein